MAKRHIQGKLSQINYEFRSAYESEPNAHTTTTTAIKQVRYR